MWNITIEDQSEIIVDLREIVQLLSAFGGNIFSDSAIIGCTTFTLSFAAAFIGKKSGDLLKDKAQLLGGIILTGMGLKIFIEHMFFGS